MVQAEQAEPTDGEHVDRGGLPYEVADLLGCRGLVGEHPGDLQGRQQPGGGPAAVPGRQAQRDAGVVGHVQPVRDPLEHLQRTHLPVPLEDLAHPALEDPDGGGDAVLAGTGVLLGHVEDGGGVAVAEDLARLVAAPCPLRKVDRLER